MKQKKMVADFPLLLEQWDYEANGDLDPRNVSFGSTKRIFWKCDVAPDHCWPATPNDRTNKSRARGCPCCQNKKVVYSNCFLTTHPELCAEWDYDRNLIQPHEVTAGSHKRVFWKCSVFPDHRWDTRVQQRTGSDETGCRYCNNSKGELVVAKTLDELQIYNKQQFKLSKCKHVMPLPFDFTILPDGKDCGFIEFQGIQHFEPREHFGGEKQFIQQRINDDLKRNFCRTNNLPLLEIHYKDLKKVPELIQKFVESLPARRTF